MMLNQSDRPPVGRVPVALYTATSNDATAHLLTSYARAFAEARDWTVTLATVDNDPTRPLDQRPGWQIVIDALNARTIKGVITWTRDMVTGGQADLAAEAFDRLATVLGDRGGFIAAASGHDDSHAPGNPLRPSPHLRTPDR
ncbi:hypothetical protein F7Q99_05500 [Streptomyces kaniharaensis]|uniref:Recombinase family protein n=1 Tax=Streptomyces kaniharaensis TaxID=212423 RepID=A0A6N7KMS4_9ACTN|nr:hypothetical protein [Streptomyces kaniharaensis]MQS11758.1 hypothetical protein [Streptomyces kaniharaensis]